MVNLMQIGILLIVLGFVIVFISVFTLEKTNVKGGGIIFIGPIPIFGAATDKKTLYILFIIGIALFILFYFIRRFI